MTRKCSAFTLVEVVISLGLLSAILAAFVVVLNSTSDALAVGCLKGVITSEVAQTLRTIEADIRESDQGQILTEQAGLPAGQCAIALPSARDSSGVFHVDSAGRPVWQALVIYCPFTTPAGVTQLRRYTYYASSSDFPFQFAPSNPITDAQILLNGQGSALIVVDRQNGNGALPAGKKHLILCHGLAGLDVTVGARTAITLRTACVTRRNMTIASQETAYVAERN